MNRSVLTSLAYSVFAGFFAIVFFGFAIHVLFHSAYQSSDQSGSRTGWVDRSPLMGIATVAAFLGSRVAASKGYLPHSLMAALFTAGVFPALMILFALASGRSVPGGHVLVGAFLGVYGLLFILALIAASIGTGLFAVLCSVLGWDVK